MFSGNDWAAVDGTPPGLQLVASWVKKSTQEPILLDYDVIVLQQVRGRRWADLIRKLRAGGVKVLYEIDDYVHGIRHAADHDFRGYYQKRDLKSMEECMRCCDGIVVSTQYLAEKYERIARDRPIWVCENGLDMGRYRLTRPERGVVDGRETVTIMWAGATGHQVATMPWIQSIGRIMRQHHHVTFASIGQNFAAVLEAEFPDRVVSVPFTALECYPGSMMLGDIAIAPAGKSDWYKAKSTLRAMESAALGIPIVADKHYEDAVIEGETGVVVQSSTQVDGALSRLVQDDDLREKMSSRARDHAKSEFAMEKRVGQWETVIAEATAL